MPCFKAYLFNLMTPGESENFLLNALTLLYQDQSFSSATIVCISQTSNVLLVFSFQELQFSHLSKGYPVTPVLAEQARMLLVGIMACTGKMMPE